MVHCSQLFNVAKHVRQEEVLSRLLKSANSLNLQHSDHIDSTSLVDALQVVMAELVKGRPSVKPMVPLRMDSEDGLPTWLMEAWVFDNFHIIAVSKYRHGSPKGGLETRLEYVPIEV